MGGALKNVFVFIRNLEPKDLKAEYLLHSKCEPTLVQLKGSFGTYVEFDLELVKADVMNEITGLDTIFFNDQNEYIAWRNLNSEEV